MNQTQKDMNLEIFIDLGYNELLEIGQFIRCILDNDISDDIPFDIYHRERQNCTSYPNIRYKRVCYIHVLLHIASGRRTNK